MTEQTTPDVLTVSSETLDAVEHALRRLLKRAAAPAAALAVRPRRWMRHGPLDLAAL